MRGSFLLKIKALLVSFSIRNFSFYLASNVPPLCTYIYRRHPLPQDSNRNGAWVSYVQMLAGMHVGYISYCCGLQKWSKNVSALHQISVKSTTDWNSLMRFSVSSKKHRICSNRSCRITSCVRYAVWQYYKVASHVWDIYVWRIFSEVFSNYVLVTLT